MNCPACKKGDFKMTQFRKGIDKQKDTAKFECDKCDYWERIP